MTESNGIHLDYVRYPGPEFDYSLAALRLFRADLEPVLSAEDRRRFDPRSVGDLIARAWPACAAPPAATGPPFTRKGAALVGSVEAASHAASRSWDGSPKRRGGSSVQDASRRWMVRRDGSTRHR